MACLRALCCNCCAGAAIRELEGLIFDCALYMDELKEHAEQIRGDPLTREPSPGPAGSSSPSEGREHPTQPQVLTEQRRWD